MVGVLGFVTAAVVLAVMQCRLVLRIEHRQRARQLARTLHEMGLTAAQLAPMFLRLRDAADEAASAFRSLPHGGSKSMLVLDPKAHVKITGV